MIFTQAFPPKSGTGKNGKPYTRWDYKTAGDERFCHFEGVDPIPVNTEVALELNPSGTIKSWKVAGQRQETSSTPEAVRSDSVAFQTPSGGGSGRDFKAEAEGKTRCALVSAAMPSMVAQLYAKDEDADIEPLLDWAFGYVFQTDAVPF